MVIRADKFPTFGIKKSSTSSIQYLPKLLTNQAVVPTVGMGMSFKYLGRYFNFSMDTVYHMSAVLGLRDESLITCWEGLEDILIYLTEFSSPLSNLCKYFDPYSKISEETP